MGKQIFAAEISHENAPFLIREMLREREELLFSSVKRSKTPLEEVFLLSTPTRFVVYAVGTSIDPLLNFFIQDPKLFQYVQFYKSSEGSINHLFATTSGLCSAIKGECQIVEYVKNDLRRALHDKRIGLVLGTMIRESIRVGHRVRTETGIDKFGASVVECGIEVVYNELSNVYDKRFLVIGAGKMAEASLSHLANEGIQHVRVASSDPRVKALGDACGVVAIHADNLETAIKEADVIISAGPDHATPVTSRVAALQGSSEKKIVLDLGSPSNFQGDIRDLPFVSYYNLDDLKKLQTTPLDLFGGLEAAWKMVAQESKLFYEYFEHLQAVPVLTSLCNKLASIPPTDKRTLVYKSGVLKNDSQMSRVPHPLQSLAEQLPHDTYTSNFTPGNVSRMTLRFIGDN